jgi:hypothetical protein
MSTIDRTRLQTVCTLYQTGCSIIPGRRIGHHFSVNFGIHEFVVNKKSCFHNYALREKTHVILSLNGFNLKIFEFKA